MTMHAPPPALLLPESAPFSPDQRAWLSGYFAALLASDSGGATAVSGADAAALGAPGGPELADNDTAPWHDPSIVLGDRMDMAKERPIAPRLMAAMAQQDCGQCGYNCADYANALFLKKEERLNLCAPGGKETARMLKALAVEIGGAPTGAALEAAASPATAVVEPSGPLGYCRENPVPAVFLSRRRLNGETSEKETWHIEIDLSSSCVSYEVGDSLGVFPSNATLVADAVIAQLGARPERLINGRTLRDHLLYDYAVGAAPDALFQLISQITGGEARKKARALASGEDPDGDAAHLDVLGRPAQVPDRAAGRRGLPRGARPPATAPLLDLVVAEGRHRQGHADDRHRAVCHQQASAPGGRVDLLRRADRGRLAAQDLRPEGARLPRCRRTPRRRSSWVGPGTGVAPFRAFLRERQAVAAPGRNWLFFGHQRQNSDFFYRDELASMRDAKHLYAADARLVA